MNKNSTASLADTSAADKVSNNKSFFKFNAAMASRLRNSRLTTSDWKLWSYLVTLDPFGDRYIKIDSVDELAKACGLTRSSFFRAKNKLKELGLFDFQGGEIYFRNLNGDKKSQFESGVAELKLPVPELGLPIPELKPSVSELGLEKAKTQSEQGVVAPQNIQTSSDASESEEEETTAAATEVALPVVEEKEIEKPVLKVRDIPEQPLAKSTRVMSLEQHMQAAETGIKPSAEIMTRLLQHSAYSVGMSALIQSNKWKAPTRDVEPIPPESKQFMEELKQKHKQNKYRVSGNAT